MMQHMSCRLSQTLLIGMFACLGIILAPLSLAQDGQRWFRVELMVFSQQGADGGEQWEATPALAYPGAARFLIEPATVSANIKRYKFDSNIDSYGRQILTEREGQAQPRPIAADAGQTTESASTALYPTPFIALPSEQQEFRGKAAYMQRSGRYRILFHETWVQPVLSKEQALPLIVDRSGDTGQWPQLQGSVKIHLSRYLHLETNLWLNTAGDYLPGDWRMPAPPLGPPSLVVEALPSEEEAKQGFGGQWIEQQDTGGEAAAELEQETGPIYPYRHAIALKQQRRMRSDEVHYIDHPRLGAVIKFLPLSEEELETLALAEADSGFQAEYSSSP